MTAIDMTSQLAPILWAMEFFLGIGVAWLFAVYTWHELHGHRELSRRATIIRVVPKATVSLSNKVSEDTLAA